jgi:hypothetical protein
MGKSPTMNIEVDVSFEEAQECVQELTEVFNYTVIDTSEDDTYFEYVLQWNTVEDEGDDADLQKLSVFWSTGLNGYTGVSSEEKLVVHYSSYYFEESIERFLQKGHEIVELREWLEDRYGRDSVTEYVGISQT